MKLHARALPFLKPEAVGRNHFHDVEWAIRPPLDQAAMALYTPGPRHKIILQPDLDACRAKFNWPIKQDVEGARMRFFAKILVQRLAATQQRCGVPPT